jgi:hypothetical protein
VQDPNHQKLEVVLHRADFLPGAEGEVAFIKAQLAGHQKEVIAMCKQYDKLMMKNMRTSGYVDKDPNNSEFGLIKKAITIITSLEELVQHSSSYIKDAIDETS